MQNPPIYKQSPMQLQPLTSSSRFGNYLFVSIYLYLDLEEISKILVYKKFLSTN